MRPLSGATHMHGRRPRSKALRMTQTRHKACVCRKSLCNVARSVQLRAGKLRHLGPFLGFVGHELREFGGRACGSSNRACLGNHSILQRQRLLTSGASSGAKAFQPGRGNDRAVGGLLLPAFTPVQVMTARSSGGYGGAGSVAQFVGMQRRRSQWEAHHHTRTRTGLFSRGAEC